MFRYMKILCNNSLKIVGGKKEFPTRKDSIKNIMNNNYDKIANDFNTYGSFINFCISETISIKSIQRRDILTKFLEKKNFN